MTSFVDIHNQLVAAAILPLHKLDIEMDNRGYTVLHAHFALSQYDLYTKFEPLASKMMRASPISSLVAVAADIVFPSTAFPLQNFVKEVQIYDCPQDLHRMIVITFWCPDIDKFSTMLERTARAKYDAEFNEQLERAITNG